jgi:serine/threonine protein kinase
MNAERWEQIKDIFDAALQQPAADRDDFVSTACGGDSELKAEICNLLAGDERAGSFLEVPAIRGCVSSKNTPSRYSLKPGDLICERFEILRFLGEGGMGQVYEALDTELEQRVALKTIHPDIASDPAVLLRFKQEVQLTRRVTHINICRTFDLERHTSPPDSTGLRNEITFLTMELLQGETLADLLRRKGRLETNEALPLAEQMAEALGAAHDAGVVHRDFKPSNVLLILSGGAIRVVVTDFGLARAVLPEGNLSGAVIKSSMTATGRVLGTMAYMAPEQLETGEATPATDIYALGLVLYEMLAGRRPFEDEIPFAEIIKRLKLPPPPLRGHVERLDPRWDATISKCLEATPSARFLKAGDVVKALQGSFDESVLNQEAKPNSWLAVWRKASWAENRSSKHHYLQITSLLLILVALFIGVLRFKKWNSQNAQVPDGARLLMMNISNESHDPELDAATELLRGQLAQSAHMNLVPPSRVREILKRMAHPEQENIGPRTAREVALRDGTPLVLFGTVSQLAEDYKLDLKLEKVGTDPAHPKGSWQFSETAATKKDFFEIVHDAGNWVRRLSGETETKIEAATRRPEDVTTDNWEALKLYSDAQKSELNDRLDEAILLYKEAAEKDPQFGMAWMRVGDILDTIGQSGEGFAYWQRARNISGDHRLSPREELRIKGMYASDTGDLTAAVEYFSQYAIAYPNDHLGFFYRGYPLMLLGKTEEAIQTLKEAEKRAPDSYDIADHLARYYLILGDFSNASRYSAKVRQLGHAEYADQLDGESRFLQGDYSHAQSLFAGLRGSSDVYLRSVSYQLQACVLAEQGRYREAIGTLKEGVKSDLTAGDSGDQADKLLALAYLYLKQGNRVESREAALKSLATAYSLERAADAGSILSRGEWIADAKKVLIKLDPSLSFPIAKVTRLRINVEILLAEGHKSEALSELQKDPTLDQKRALLRDYSIRALIANDQWDEALQELDQPEGHPGQIWHQAESYAPGADADLLFLRARAAFHEKRSRAKPLLLEYSTRRQYADPGLPEVTEARSMLKHLVE